MGLSRTLIFVRSWRLIKRVLEYRYNYELQRGDIRCTGPADKEGVITFFTDIDPDVEQIVVYVGGKPDEWYALEDGQWNDIRPVTK